MTMKLALRPEFLNFEFKWSVKLFTAGLDGPKETLPNGEGNSDAREDTFYDAAAIV